MFGESGSGKTVMVSSFYGASQEPQVLQKSLFRVVADDIGQGSRLQRNYLGMKNSARLPEPTRFAATSYSFSIKLKDESHKAAKSRAFDSLRLVWHDYPGEWFEQDVSGPEEAQRRVDTFRSLLTSDVALLLVDGQRLLDNAGEEERYLKSLLNNFRNGLLSLKDDLLVDGKRFVEFPRIWVLALSKSDLLPDLDVFGFRDLLIEKASDEMDELRQVLGGLIEASDALSVGEDFVLLSSAKFDSTRIEVNKRVGLDLILPIAAMLPFERHISWLQSKQIPARVTENLLSGLNTVAGVLVGLKVNAPGPLGLVMNLVTTVLSKDVLDTATDLAGDKLRTANAQALAKQEYLAATLTGFRMDLEHGEKERILLRSLR